VAIQKKVLKNSSKNLRFQGRQGTRSNSPEYERLLEGRRVCQTHLLEPFCERGIGDEFRKLAPTRQGAPGRWCQPVAERLLNSG
jgi:hypothetical protein